jgi:hypothetical protein
VGVVDVGNCQCPFPEPSNQDSNADKVNLFVLDIRFVFLNISNVFPLLMCVNLMFLVRLQHFYRPDGPLGSCVFSRNEDGDMELDAALLEPFITQARKFISNTHGCIAAIVDLDDISDVSKLLLSVGLHLHFRFIVGQFENSSDGRVARKPYFEVSQQTQIVA